MNYGSLLLLAVSLQVKVLVEDRGKAVAFEKGSLFSPLLCEWVRGGREGGREGREGREGEGVKGNIHVHQQPLKVFTPFRVHITCGLYIITVL